MERQEPGVKDAKQSNEIFQFPDRPGMGSHGYPVELYSTYVELSLHRRLTLYRYLVEIEPEDRSRSFISMSQLIPSLLHEHFAEYTHSIVSDCKSTLISSHELAIGTGAYTVHYLRELSRFRLKMKMHAVSV